MHMLNDSWTLWSHLPHNTNWCISSYIKVKKCNTIEDIVLLSNEFDKKMLNNCMWFYMKNNIKPLWEDSNNNKGGCYSYKIMDKDIEKYWKKILYLLIGCNITSSDSEYNNINGISISPKKNFCIIKIWMSNSGYTNKNIFIKDLLDANIPIFKSHN